MHEPPARTPGFSLSSHGDLFALTVQEHAWGAAFPPRLSQGLRRAQPHWVTSRPTATRPWSHQGLSGERPAMHHSHGGGVPTGPMSSDQCDISEQGPGKSGREGGSPVPLPDAPQMELESPPARRGRLLLEIMHGVGGGREPLLPRGQGCSPVLPSFKPFR